jgi:hypothetical protein
LELDYKEFTFAAALKEKKLRGRGSKEVIKSGIRTRG